jgi:hypothetical protein
MEPFRLVDGIYKRKEALELLERLKQAKIDYLEQRIGHADEVEDIGHKERRILELLAEFEQMKEATRGKDNLVLKVLVWS